MEHGIVEQQDWLGSVRKKLDHFRNAAINIKVTLSSKFMAHRKLAGGRTEAGVAKMNNGIGAVVFSGHLIHTAAASNQNT